MKFFKVLIFLSILIVLIYIGLCALAPKSLDTTRQTTIDAPPTLVFNLVNNLPSWEKWLPCTKLDTTMKFVYSDKKEGVGASYSWTSENMVDGTVKIIESEKNKSLKTELIFDGKGSSNGIWDISQEENGTRVSWGMKSDNDVNFFMRGVMFAKGTKTRMENNFDKGLAAIKEIAESRKNGEYNGYKINTVEMPEKHYVLSRAEVSIDKVQQFYVQSLSSIFTKIQPAGVEIDGMPSSLFFKWDESKRMTDMAASIPLTKPAAINGTKSLTISAKQALQIDYYGDTSKTLEAHMAMEEYLNDNGLLSDVPVVEEYVSDPEKVLDPSKYLTKITYYLAN